MLRLLVLACIVAAALSSGAARAAEPRQGNAALAQQRFREARLAFDEGRYAAAASLFEAADRLAPHPSTRFNAAAAWDQAGEFARAATGYEAALSPDLLDPGRKEEAERRLRELRQSLGRVLIKQPLGAFITVDHMQRVPVPAAFYLTPGSYDIQVEYRGTQSVTRTEVVAGGEHDVTLDLPESVVPQAPPVRVTPSPPVAPVPPPPPADDGATQKTLGWIGVGAGVALSGAAIIFGVRALAAKDKFDASLHTDASARREASDLRLATNVLWGGATLTGAAGLVLLLTAPSIEF